MKCKKCGKNIAENAQSCPHCGQPVIRIRPKHLCKECGTEVPDTAKQCPGCGKNIVWGNRVRNFDDYTPSLKDSIAGPSFSDLYAWAQAIVPILVSLFYFFLANTKNDGTRLFFTILYFVVLTVFCGFIDLRKIEESLGKENPILTEELRFQMVCLPIVGLFKRRQITGMKVTALYPHIHAILLLLFVFILSYGGSLNELFVLR